MKANNTQKVPELSGDTLKLYNAVTNNDLARVKKYANISRIFTLKNDKTIFTHACEKYKEIHSNIIKCLIGVIKKEINQIYPNGGTPLIDVIKTGNIELVVEAIIAGANVNQPDVNGELPLVVALKKPETRIGLLLKAHNAKVNLELNEELSNPKNLQQKTSFRHTPLFSGIKRNPKRNSLPDPLKNDNDNHVENTNTIRSKMSTKNVPPNTTTTTTTTKTNLPTPTPPQTPPEDYGFKF